MNAPEPHCATSGLPNPDPDFPWWLQAAWRGTPVRGEIRDGLQECIFVWQAQATTQTQAPLAAVFIEVYSHTAHAVRSENGPTPMQRYKDTAIWYWRTWLPLDWCGSYFFVPATAADLPVPTQLAQRRRWWIALLEEKSSGDPWNPAPIHSNGWGRPLGGIYPAPPQRAESAPKHRLRKHRWFSARLGNERAVWQYRTGPASAPLPLVLLLDGQHWVAQPGLLAALDEYTAQSRLPAAAYVFISAIDPAARASELPCNPAFWQALQAELLPLLDRYGSLTKTPQQTLVVGQSLGGLAAVYAALHWPERFGLAFSQSGSFWWPDPKETGAGGWLTCQLQQGALSADLASPRPMIQLEIGSYEADMLGVNRALHAALAAKGYAVSYREFRGGHDWLCWRQSLLAGISGLLSAADRPGRDRRYAGNGWPQPPFI